EEELEKERIENKKTVTKQKEEYAATVNSKDREIDALKLFSKNHSEYITDMRLIGIRERLVNEKRIRPEDMHIMANIFLPRNEISDVQRISHLVLTRTGLYIIDSQLLKGHVYNGVSAAQFKEQPTLEHVFNTLDLDNHTPQTLVLDRNEDMHIMANIFLPRNEISDVQRISHLVLTRSGLYIIDSQLLKGHVYNGVSAAQFKEQPTLEHVFNTLDLDNHTPQTLVLDRNE